MARDAKPRTAPRRGGASREPRRATIAPPGNARANFAWVMAVGRDVLIAPHRPVVVRNARGAIMTSRRVRGPAAHRAAGGEPPLASRGLQNSQRVLHAKPRTAPMACRRDGDIAPYRYGTAP